MDEGWGGVGGARLATTGRGREGLLSLKKSNTSSFAISAVPGLLRGVLREREEVERGSEGLSSSSLFLLVVVVLWLCSGTTFCCCSLGRASYSGYSGSAGEFERSKVQTRPTDRQRQSQSRTIRY